MIQIVHECESVVHMLWECPVHVYDSIGSIWVVKSKTLLFGGRWWGGGGGGGEFEEFSMLANFNSFVLAINLRY